MQPVRLALASEQLRLHRCLRLLAIRTVINVEFDGICSQTLVKQKTQNKQFGSYIYVVGLIYLRIYIFAKYRFKVNLRPMTVLVFCGNFDFFYM